MEILLDGPPPGHGVHASRQPDRHQLPGTLRIYRLGAAAVLVRDILLKPFIALQDEVPQLKDNVRSISGNILAHTLDQVFALGQKKKST